MWWQQFKKELMSHRGESLLVVGALVIWTVFLLTRIGVWRPDVITGAYWAPMGFLPLWVLWTSMQLYRQEWRENTSYLMLSLPARAWVITSAKLAVIAASLVVFTLLIALGGWIVASRTGILALVTQTPEFAALPKEWLVKTALTGYGVLLASLITLGFVVQFAYVFSRLFARFQGLLMLWTSILVSWLLSRVADLGSVILGWLPDIHVQSVNIALGIAQFDLVRIESGPIVAVALALVGLYTLLNAIIERAVEV